jgi:hypothetical protein
VAAVKKVSTPVWVRLLAWALLIGVPGWLIAGYLDRKGNERRLAAIAGEIAGRPVHVRCPGVIARHFSYEMLEGSVQFDADGRPSDTTKLRARPCAELDALAEGRRSHVLACVAAHGACGEAGRRLASAVDTVTHESYHLAGIADEAETECRSINRMAWTAERLGATPGQGRALAEYQFRHDFPLLPDRYRLRGCRLTAQ